MMVVALALREAQAPLVPDRCHDLAESALCAARVRDCFRATHFALTPPPTTDPLCPSNYPSITSPPRLARSGIR